MRNESMITRPSDDDDDDKQQNGSLTQRVDTSRLLEEEHQEEEEEERWNGLRCDATGATLSVPCRGPYSVTSQSNGLHGVLLLSIT